MRGRKKMREKQVCSKHWKTFEEECNQKRGRKVINGRIVD